MRLTSTDVHQTQRRPYTKYLSTEICRLQLLHRRHLNSLVASAAACDGSCCRWPFWRRSASRAALSVICRWGEGCAQEGRLLIVVKVVWG